MPDECSTIRLPWHGHGMSIIPDRNPIGMSELLMTIGMEQLCHSPTLSSIS